jgi:hypothetical protein
MDSTNSSPDQENGGEQEPSELPILSDEDNDLEPSYHVPLLVNERLQLLLLTIAALPCATRRRNKT